VPLRWPWRKTEPAAPRLPGNPSAAPPVQRAAADEWRAVPPPDGLNGPLELTADRRFGRELSGHRSLPPVIGQVARGGDLAPMMRPVGTRRAATHDGPTAGYGRSSDMTLRPQRSPRPGASHDVETGIDPDSHATSESPLPESPLPAPSVPNRIEAISAGERSLAQAQGGAPQRSAMTVVPTAQRSAISEGLPPPGQLWLDETAGPVPEVTEVPAPAASSARSEPSMSATEARPRPATASQASPAGQRSPVAPATQRSPMAGPRRTVHSNASSTRRVGLGAPLAQRFTPRGEAQPASPTSTRAPVPTGPPLSSAPPGPAPTDLSTGDDRAVVPLATPGPGLELIAPAPRGATPASPTSGTAPGTQASAAASPPALPRQRSARTTAPPIHQRASAGRSSAATPTTAPSTSSSKVRIDRSNEGAATAAGMDANAFTAGDTIVMPSSHGQLDRGRGQALLAHELVHVGQQRRMGAGLPPEHSSAGQQLEREAQSAESLVEQVSRSASPRPDMPMTGAGPRRSPAEASPSHSREVRHATELALATGQRAGNGSGDAIELPATPAPGDAPGPQRAPAAAAASPASLTATAGAKPGDDEEFEELARRMYERLRLRLKRELLLDRERSGFLADSR